MGTLWGGVGIGGARGGLKGHLRGNQERVTGGPGGRRWPSRGASGSLGGTLGSGQGPVRVGDRGPPGGGVWARGPISFAVYF